MSLGDIVPLNIPPGATTSYQPNGWYLGPDGNWYWNGNNVPNLTIPITTGPDIPQNAGWVFGPTQQLVWTGPGTQPAVIPATNIYVPIISGKPNNSGWVKDGRNYRWTGPGNSPTSIPGTAVNPLPSAQGPLFNWTPQPVIPDSMLPPVLQRSNPLVAPAQWIPNKYDMEVIGRARKWQWIASHGGLKSCCRIPELGAPIYDPDPPLAMPSDGFEFAPMQGLPITAFQNPATGAFTGLDVQILSLVVPSGYDGVINRFVASTSNVTGYADFTGNIAWRLMYGIRFAKNFGNVTNTFGSLQNAFTVPGRFIARVISGQTIQLFANVPLGSPIAGGSINAGVFGWFYPRR